MPYTKARLEHALKAFREPPSLQLARSLQSRNFAHTLRSYHLRSPPKVIYDYDGPSRRVRGGARKSDDDYDPSEERRQLNAAAKKKRTAQKRKAEGEVDTEKKSKRSKISVHVHESTYVTLKFTTKAGKKLLADLASIRGTDHSQQRSSNDGEIGSNYWKSNGDTNGLRTGIYNSDMEEGFDNDFEVLTVGLRNGKVPKKQINQDRKAKSKNSPPSPQAHDKQDANANSSLLNIATHTENGERDRELSTNGDIDDDLIYDFPATKKEKVVTASFSQSKPRLEVQPAKTIALRQPGFTFGRSNPTQEYASGGAGVSSIETHYAHPINFQSPQTPCDFCGNYRMGIVGLGKKVVSVYADPSDPTKLEEVGNGWRAQGYPETKMCTVCGLKRLMIAQCHAPIEPEHEMSVSSSEPEPQFMLITGTSYSPNELEAYARDLVNPNKRPVLFRDLNSKGCGLPPSCSLCPGAAYWRCCKWQNVDTANGQCASVTVKTDYKIARETVNGKKRDVVCLDSDTDDDGAASLPPAKRRMTEFRTPTPIRLLSGNPRNGFSTNLGDPVRGCGLYLCYRCKVFLVGQCDGKLDKAEVWNFLRNDSSLPARADVEFLFKGSDLEQAHSHGIVRL